MFEFIVFFTSFKYIFVEGGEQVLVGIGTLSRIGLKQTLQITILAIAVGISLYFLFLNFAGLVPTNILQIALGVGLLFFSATMFKEFFEDDQKEVSVTKYRIGYFYIAMVEAVENSVALATFSLIEFVSAVIGALVAIGLILGLVFLGVIKRMPLKLTRLVAGVLLALTGIPPNFVWIRYSNK
ncbi:MAG: hypothetical protein ACREAJ_00735 [Nitrosopumilaceae archaeon]